MSASYDAEKNPYVRRIMARMWIATARIESPGDAVRGETAANALREVELQIGRLTDQCAKDVVAASDWARSAKQGLERKYLTSVDLLGEQNVDTKAIDAQVIVLRDEIEGLERTLQPCPRRYFGPEDQ